MPLAPMPERSWPRTTRTISSASPGLARRSSSPSTSALRSCEPAPLIPPSSSSRACTSRTLRRPPSSEMRCSARIFAARPPMSPSCRSSALISSAGWPLACARAFTTRLSPIPSLSGRFDGVSCMVAIARHGRSSSGASDSAETNKSVMNPTRFKRADSFSTASSVSASRVRGMPTASAAAVSRVPTRRRRTEGTNAGPRNGRTREGSTPKTKGMRITCSMMTVGFLSSAYHSSSRRVRIIG